MGFWSGVSRFVKGFVGAVGGVALDFIGSVLGFDWDLEPEADPVTGIPVNRNSNVRKRSVIYGRRQISGVQVFSGVEGSNKEFLHKVLDLCEGEIEEIESIEIDGTFSTDERYTGTKGTGTGYTSDTAGYAAGSTSIGLISGAGTILTGGHINFFGDSADYVVVTGLTAPGTIVIASPGLRKALPANAQVVTVGGSISHADETKYVGTDTQAADSNLVAQFTDWTTAHQLKGVAYLHERLRFDKNVYMKVPNIKIIVKGKKVYNVLTSITEYTTDPASCIYDYCINGRYGRGIAPAELNLASFQSAANYYAEQVETFTDSGVFINRFEMNMMVDTSRTVAANLEAMLGTVRSHLVYINGEYHLKPLKGETSVFSFSENNIIDRINIIDSGKKTKLNRVKIGFINPAKKWQPDYVIVDSATFLAADNGVVLDADVTLPGETSFYRTMEYADTILKESRESLSCSIKSNLSAWKVEPGDVIDITWDSFGWVNKTFRAWSVKLNWDGTVEIAAKEHEDSVYDYSVTVEETPPPNTELTDPFTIIPPVMNTLVADTVINSDGTTVPRIKVSWTDETEGYTDHYVLEYKASGDANWTSLNISRSNEHYINGVKIGVLYVIRLKSVNTYGVSSVYDSFTITPGGDTTAPGVASSLVAVTALKGINLKWTNPTDADFDHVDIYRHTSDIPGGDKSAATRIASVKTDSYTDTNADSGTTYYYWLKAVDHTGNVGSFFPATNGVSGTTNTMINTMIIPNVGPAILGNFGAQILLVRKVTPANSSTVDIAFTYTVTNSDAAATTFTIDGEGFGGADIGEHTIAGSTTTTYTDTLTGLSSSIAYTVEGYTHDVGKLLSVENMELEIRELIN